MPVSIDVKKYMEDVFSPLKKQGNEEKNSIILV